MSNISENIYITKYLKETKVVLFNEKPNEFSPKKPTQFLGN